MSLVINNTTTLSCMYFTTSSWFHSLAFGFHMAESIVSSVVLETYHTTWYKMVQEFRHITMTAHIIYILKKKKSFRFLQLLKLLQLFQRQWQDTTQENSRWSTIQSDVNRNNLINEEGGRRKQRDGALLPHHSYFREINLMVHLIKTN